MNKLEELEKRIEELESRVSSLEMIYADLDEGDPLEMGHQMFVHSIRAQREGGG